MLAQLEKKKEKKRQPNAHKCRLKLLLKYQAKAILLLLLPSKEGTICSVKLEAKAKVI